MAPRSTVIEVSLNLKALSAARSAPGAAAPSSTAVEPAGGLSNARSCALWHRGACRGGLAATREWRPPRHCSRFLPTADPIHKPLRSRPTARAANAWPEWSRSLRQPEPGTNPGRRHNPRYSPNLRPHCSHRYRRQHRHWRTLRCRRRHNSC